jgi:LPS sulfotransferase NodH
VDLHPRRWIWRAAERRLAPLPAPGIGERVPVFVLSTARAGSHHLTGLLRGLPGVSVRGEILNPKSIPRWLQPAVRNQAMRFTSRPRALAYVARVLAAMPGPVCVVRLLPSHLARAGISAQDLHEAFPDALFLVLYRRSLAAQYVSWRISRSTGRWASWGENRFEPFAGKIAVDPEEFRRWCESERSDYAGFLAAPGVAKRGIVVCHEDLVADPAGVLAARVLPRLGIRASAASSPWRKMNTRPLSDVIENYEAVRALLDSPEARQDWALP